MSGAQHPVPGTRDCASTSSATPSTSSATASAGSVYHIHRASTYAFNEDFV
jgi:hypothetical protein